MKTKIFMRTLTTLLLGALLLFSHSVFAKSDKQIMADVQKARQKNRLNGDHSKHVMPAEFSDSEKFRGVYYGYLPCDFCAGVKMTLSLKNKKNYLLVIQYAQASNREHFEKGKYDWDTKSNTVTLNGRKGSKTRILRILNKGDELVVLDPKGKPMTGNQDQYTLVRSDKNKAREVHIH